MPSAAGSESRRLDLLWGLSGALLVVAASALAAASPRFGYDHAVRDMPVLWFAGGFVLVGAAYLALPFLIRATLRESVRPRPELLLFIFLAGLVARLALFASEPVLEDDYQRYLWDGAVTAHWLNPYAIAPEDAQDADPATPLGQLAAQAGPVLDRIRYAELRTIYPPVAQAAFALAHVLKPFSLTAWRTLCLALDIAVGGLILAILRDLARAPLSAALYWWNPLAIKEIINSAHMDAVVVALVLLALLLAMRRRLLLATAGLVLAAGAKLWPVLLLPMVWRPLLPDQRRLAVAIVLTAAIGGLLSAPIVAAGLDDSSGFIAYASSWRTNSAHIPVLEAAAGALLAALDVTAVSPATALRALIGAALTGLALWAARTPFGAPDDLIRRSTLVVGALFLLSPAQYPWYFVWLLPLLSLQAGSGLLVLTATLPLYYASFHFGSRGVGGIFDNGLVWLIWLPAWLVMAFEARKRLARRRAHVST